MTDELPYPSPGERFEDAEGRRLHVTHVFPGDRLGREIRGLLSSDTHPEPEHYTCDQRIWARVWLERAESPVFRQ